MKRPPPKILLPIALVAAVACSSGPGRPPPLPGLSLASTVGAEAAFRPLLKRWANALTPEERLLLRPDLLRFRASHPTDGEIPAAEALLAWIAVERGDLDEARQLARRAALLGEGSWQDFATLVEGAVRRRNRDPQGALSTLSPLVSKLIDPWARDLLNEEIITAAILAGSSARAVKMMSVWLREAGDEERALVRSRVEQALARLGDAELVKIFDERAARAAGTPDNEIDPLLAQRLAEIAIRTRDAVLAKKLLLTSGALLGDRGDAVARLAAGAAATRVDARTVGLLLSFRTSETRRRSAEVAAGVAWGLGLPGPAVPVTLGMAPPAPAVRLAMRDDAGESGRLEEALTELGRAGAAVVIAGIDAEDARVAARFAEGQQMPVILLTRRPDISPPGAGGFVLTLGVSEQGWGPEKDGRYDAWIAEYSSPPPFWSAAGRDAAALARIAVQNLPQAATEEIAEVQKRRRDVRDALRTAPRERLWTGNGVPLD